MFFVNVTFPEPQTGRVYQIMMSLLFGDKSTEILSTYPRQVSFRPESVLTTKTCCPMILATAHAQHAGNASMRSRNPVLFGHG